MKKIANLLILFVTGCAFAQLTPPEDFEDPWTPNGPTGWGIYQNTVSLTQKWRQSNPDNILIEPPHEGLHCAFINVQTGPAGGTAPQDWFVSPAFTLPADPQLRFWSRLGFNGNQQGVYKIKIMYAIDDPALLTSYQDIITWGELALNPTQQAYTEKLVSTGFPAAMIGQQVRIAFFMEGNQADRWLIDNVSVETICGTPATLQAATIDTNSAVLSWTQPGTIPPQWEIEIKPNDIALDGTNTVIVSSPTYTIPDNLLPDTPYKYCVRALCSPTNPGPWTLPYVFITNGVGDTCADPIVISTLPYSTTDNTMNYDDDFEGSPGTTGCGTTGNFLNGNEVVYSYTAAVTGTISINMTGNGANSAMFIYDDCADIGVNCIAGGTGSATVPVVLPSVAVTAGTTYYIVISSSTTLTTPYNLVVQVVNCAQPTGLTAENANATMANLSWAAGTATSWQVVVQAANTGIPQGAGTTTSNNTNYTATIGGLPLTPATNYEYYVRADCNNGTFSAWSGPFAFTTTQVTAPMDFTDNFEGVSGWLLANGTQVNKWAVGNAVNNGGTQSLYISNDNGTTNNYTHTTSVVHAYRDIQMPGTVNQLLLSYDWRAQGESCCDYLKVWIVPSNFTPTTGTLIGAGTNRIPINGNQNNNADFTTVSQIVNANAYSGQVLRLVFEWRNDGGGGISPAAAVDNVNLSIISCSTPSALTVSNVQDDEVTLNWTAATPVPASGYDYYISPTNTPPTDTTTPTDDVPTGTTATAGGLTPSTTYYTWIRSNCGAGDTSFWIGPVQFNTAQIPAVMDFSEGFETPAQWTLANGTSVNKWTVGGAVNNGGAQSLYISNDNGVTNNYTNSSSAVVHAYRDIQMPVSVNQLLLSYDWRALAEPCCDYLKVWIVPSNFTPTTGTMIGAGTNRIPINGNQNNNADFTTVSQVINASAYSNQILRLVFEWRNDGDTGPSPAAAVDNINLSVITCPAPSALVTSNIQEDGVTLDWTANTQTPSSGYDYYISPTNTPPTAATTPTDDVPTGTTVDVEGLNPSTIYYGWVRANCGTGDTSFWVGPVQFITTQIPAELDYIDGFEGTTTLWTINNGTQTNQWVIGSAVNNGGAQSLYITNDGGVTNAYSNTLSTVHAYRDIQLPPDPIEQLGISFDWRAMAQQCCDYLKVWAVPSDFTPTPGTLITANADRIPLSGNLNQNGTFITATYTLPAATYTGQVRRIVFEWRNDGTTNTDPPAAIDNINISVVTCKAPTAPGISNITQNTANASWTAPSPIPGSGYDYYVSTSTIPPVEATTPSGSSTTTSAGLSDLLPSTTYYFWVRSNCGTGDVSFWTGPLSFTTLQIPAALNFEENFEGPINWTLNNGASANAWVIGTATSSSAPNSLYISNDNGVTNNYTTSSGTVVHAYRDIQLPALLGDVDFSFEWKGQGEFNDYLRVWLVPINYPLAVGTQITADPSRKQFGGNMYAGTNWQTANFIESWTAFQGSTMRLVFEWRSNTFTGTNPGSAVDNINISIVTCPKPTGLTADPGQNDVTLDWTEAGTSTEWEVYVMETGSAPPTMATAGVPTDSHPFTYDIDIEPSTSYVYYVRAVCADDDKSKWAGPFPFVTDIGNDDCPNAAQLTVNLTEECIDFTTALFTGATVSSEANTCTVANGGDIWYEFTATSTAHNVTLSNFSGAIQSIAMALYEGDDCGALTQLECSVNNVILATGLVAGTTYKLRVYPAVNGAPLTSTFDICITTPPPPTTANPTDCIITTINYDFEEPQTTGIYPNMINHYTVPGWRTTASDNIMEFWMQGNYENTPAYSGNQFIELNANLVSGIYQDYETPQPTVFSYSFAHRGRQGTDTCQLYAGPPGAEVPVGAPAVTGNTEWVVYSGTYTVPANQPVTRFVFQSVSSVGGVSVGNFLDAITFTANNGILSQNPVLLDCVNNVANVSAAGVGTWIAHTDNPSPTVIAGANDNDTTISGFVASGTYLYDWTTQYCSSTLQITYDNGDIPAPVVDNTNVDYCANDTAVQLTAQALQDHTIQWCTDPEGNNILPDAPTPDTATAGTTVYYVKQTSPDGCVSPTTAITITVHDLPVEPAATNAVYCTGDTAVVLTATPDAGNTLTWYADDTTTIPLAEAPTPDTSVNGVTTYYVSQSLPSGCESPRQAVTVTVNPSPIFSIGGNINICEGTSATITVIPTNFNHDDVTYTWIKDSGTLDWGEFELTVTENGIYEVIASIGDCSVSASVEVTVTPMPVADDFTPVTSCNSYMLPNLSPGNTYHTEPGGSGDTIAEGSTIDTSTIIYVYAQNGICFDESSFEIAIISTPLVEVIGDCEGSEYVLRASFLNSVYNEDDVIFEWSDPTGAPIGGDESFLAIREGGNYQLTVTPVNGDTDCPAVLTIPAEDVTCTIQKGISPNDDGMNDFFDLKGMNVTSLTIFNRYGREVYSKSNYSNEWYGQTNDGKELPTGTYYYSMERATGENNTGWIYINRQEN